MLSPSIAAPVLGSSKRTLDADDSSSTSESTEEGVLDCEEISVPDALQQATKSTEIHFNADAFLQHADTLSVAEAATMDRIGAQLGFANLALWRSFGFFVLCMLAVQPEILVPPAMRARCLAGASAGGPHWHAICSTPQFLGGCPALDAGLRSRPVFAVRMFALLFETAEVTAARFALWSFHDCPFRYTGTTNFMNLCFLKDPLPKEFAGGLVEENRESWVAHARDLAIRLVELRTSVAALFNGHDRRRGLFHRSIHVPPVVAPSNRLYDNMVSAFSEWATTAISVGTACFQLYNAVLSGTSNADLLEVAWSLVLALLCYPLVGRPRVPTKTHRNLKIFSYPAKFLLEDHLQVIGHVACRGSQLPRCPCVSCSKILWLRQHIMCFGPAPRALFRALRPSAPSMTNVLPTYVHMRELFEAEYEASLDLYTFQALPCFWRAFLELERMSVAANAVPADNKSRYRHVCERLFLMETLRIADLERVLDHEALLPQYRALSLSARASLLEMAFDDALHWMRQQRAAATEVIRVRKRPLERRNALGGAECGIELAIATLSLAGASQVVDPPPSAEIHRTPTPAPSVGGASASKHPCRTFDACSYAGCVSRHGYSPKCKYCVAHCPLGARCKVRSHKTSMALSSWPVPG